MTENSETICAFTISLEHKTTYAHFHMFLFPHKENISWKPDLISDFIFDFTAAGVVPCGGRKTSPRTSTIVQFIFYFGPLRSAIIF